MVRRNTSQLKPLEVGSEYISKSGDKYKVLEYQNAFNVTIEFIDPPFVKVIRRWDVLNGGINNPMKPRMCGRGFMGDGKFCGKGYIPEYRVWSDMFRRCYNEASLVKCPTYKGCTVADEWCNFQVFAEWLTSRKQHGMGWKLDKDLLVSGNRVYSSQTCCLLPGEINMFLAYTRRVNKTCELPGVYFDKKSNCYRSMVTFRGVRKNLGLSQNPRELYELYKEEKERQAKFLAEYWKTQLDNEAYEALKSWKIIDEEVSNED